MQINSTYNYQKLNFKHHFEVQNVTKIMILKYKNIIKIQRNYKFIFEKMFKPGNKYTIKHKT